MNPFLAELITLCLVSLGLAYLFLSGPVMPTDEEREDPFRHFLWFVSTLLTLFMFFGILALALFLLFHDSSFLQ